MLYRTSIRGEINVFNRIFNTHGNYHIWAIYGIHDRMVNLIQFRGG